MFYMNNYIKKILYLGPEGSNTQLACAHFLEKLDLNAELESVSTITKIIDILDEAPDSVAAVLPVENSIEGVVRETIDNLVKTESDIFIQAEISLPICHCLVSKGNKKEDIKTIVSITQALAQCKNYIAENFDNNIKTMFYTSTSAAAKYVSEKDETYAAIAGELCARLYGLNIIDECINDIKDNKTRFIFLSKKNIKSVQKTRTSIAFTTLNKPGALLSVLEILKKYDLNCIYLESRPSKKVFGEYIFYADIDKGIDDIKEAMAEIEKVCTYTRILGSYYSF